jgi:hypothetical protein
MLLAMPNIVWAIVLSDPWASTTPSRCPFASKWLTASMKPIPVFSAGLLRPPDGQLDLPRESAKLLTQPQRRRVHQVRPADLDDPVPLRRLFDQRFVQRLERRQQSVLDLHRHRDMDRRREGVVGALTHVDVIVGVDRFLRGEAVAPKHLDRPIADHLVDVHVAARPRPRLEDVDRELVGHLSRGDLFRRREHPPHLGFRKGPLPRPG